MTLPHALIEAVRPHLGSVRGAAPVSGGCINHGMRVGTAAGDVFLKYNDAAPPGLFAAEARGLDALRAAADGALHVPRVLAHADAADGAPAWLAMEWLEPVPPGADHDARLARGLAALHAAPAADWGWEAGNFIGPLPQENRPVRGGWAAFWRTRRLEPQLALARRAGRRPGPETAWERLFDALPERLAPAEADGPSLLHGDLWSGNVVASAHGPALIDPAVYRGHREADLAMMELFGGFGARVQAAYREARPLHAGYPARRGVYQLYYLLVHVNLFGGGYVQRTADALDVVLSA